MLRGSPKPPIVLYHAAMSTPNRAPNSKSMRIIGLAGWSGAGKTTLITRVIPLLNAARPQGRDRQACASCV